MILSKGWMLPRSKGMKGDKLHWWCCGTNCHQRGRRWSNFQRNCYLAHNSSWLISSSCCYYQHTVGNIDQLLFNCARLIVCITQSTCTKISYFYTPHDVRDLKPVVGHFAEWYNLTYWNICKKLLHVSFNPLNSKLNPICHLLALLGAHHIFHVSGLRVKHQIWDVIKLNYLALRYHEAQYESCIEIEWCRRW